MNAPSILDVLQAVVRDGLWVPFDVYRYNYGESQETVYTRRSKGIWQDGIHCKVIKGAGLWVNLMAVNAWASNAKCESRKGSLRDVTGKDGRSVSGSPSCTGTSNAASRLS